MSTKVITGVARLSFPHLFEKHAVGDKGEPKYSCMLLIPKSDRATIKKLRDAQQENDDAQDNPTDWFDGHFNGVQHDSTVPRDAAAASEADAEKPETK